MVVNYNWINNAQALTMKKHETEINSFDDWLDSCKISQNLEMRQALSVECTSIFEDTKTRSEAANVIISNLKFFNLTEKQRHNVAQIVNDNITVPQDEAVNAIVNAMSDAIDQQVNSLGETILADGCVII
jgi:hypothetical protein